MKKCTPCNLNYESGNRYCSKCGLELTNETLEKDNQNNLITEILTEFLKNTGYIIFYLDDVYIQLYNDIGASELIVESVSEYYSQKAANKTDLFNSLGFERNEANNYSKLHKKNPNSVEELVSLLENSFDNLFNIPLNDCSLESDIIKVNSIIDNKQKRAKNELQQTITNANPKNYSWLMIAAFVAIALWLFQSNTKDDIKNVYRINQNTLGAYSEADMEKLREYAYDNDQEALKKLILNGKIVELKSGSEVFLIHTNLTTSEIRIKGQDFHIWIPSKAISSNE